MRVFGCLTGIKKRGDGYLRFLGKVRRAPTSKTQNSALTLHAQLGIYQFFNKFVDFMYSILTERKCINSKPI